jgi:LPXTG-motif cell wall-anchored protein
MRFEGGAMVYGRRGLGVALAVLAAAMLVLSGLFASPAKAQQGATPPDGVVVDLEVVPVEGECGEDGCPEGERPVTFDVVAEVNEDASIPLDPAEINAINDVLDAAEFNITVEDPDGGTPQEVEEEVETICLEPGEYDAFAEPANATNLAEDIADAVNNTAPTNTTALEPDNVEIVEFDDTFVVEECDGDDNGGDVIIDDRDQENVCNQVVNIVLEDVQNNDVNNTQYADVDVGNQQSGGSSADGAGDDAATGDVTNDQAVEVSQEQVVEIAQELNVSPTIVQTCIQQNAGRDAIIVIDDSGRHHGGKHHNDDGKHHGGKVLDQHAGAGVAGGSTDVILETIPRKDLPNTGGSPVVWAGIVALIGLYAALLTWRVRRRGW